MKKKEHRKKKKNLFIKPSVVAFFVRQLGVVLVIAFSVNSCSTPSKEKPKFELTKREHLDLEKFFRFFFLREGAIYTLCGTKPITEVHIDFPKKQLQELSDLDIQKHVYFEINKNDKDHILFYKLLSKENKEKAILIGEKNFISNTDELWEVWEKASSCLPTPQKYLFVRKEVTEPALLEESKKIYQIYFVNILQTTLVLKENYELFKQAIGFDFDPLSAVLEMPMEGSKFWKALDELDQRESCVLWGVLFGYGKINSICYQLRGRKFHTKSAEEKEFLKTLHHKQSNREPVCDTEKSAYTLKKFPIPCFASFVQQDPIIEKYEQEREVIRKQFRKKDFVLHILELLYQ